MSALERSTILGPFPLPEITDEIRQRARAQAGINRWMVFEDPAAPVDPNRPVPRGVIQGGYEVDEHGELTGRYQINPHYRPSEQVSGMPLSRVELVLWRALHGYNPAGYLADMLDRAELALYAEYEGDQRIQVARNDRGQAVLTAFTSPTLLPESWSHHHLVPGWTIIDAMANEPVFLDLNPGTRLALQIMIRDLSLLLTERSREARRLGVLPFGE